MGLTTKIHPAFIAALDPVDSYYLELVCGLNKMADPKFRGQFVAYKGFPVEIAYNKFTRLHFYCCGKSDPLQKTI